MLAPPGGVDAEKLAVEWCKQVDRVNVFPKLPVCLCSHRKAWEQNRRARDAVKSMTSRVEMLDELNKKEAPADKAGAQSNTAPNAWQAWHSRVPILL
jgi:hypothetical protein